MNTQRLIPAAEYIRVSCNEQHCSAEFQREEIRRYAQRCGFQVIKSYEDIGKSGLAIKRRKALQALLRDVLDPAGPIQAILVYDVSRWGRFQDCDEGAHYEFLCRQAGVSVRYCAEDFSNDHSIQDAILKTIKRTMAAEFSSELSKRCGAGQRRSASSGFRPGGPAGYGLRRAAVGIDGCVKRILERGERKPCQSDKVILVPGPPAEVRCVRSIFRSYLEGRGRLKPGLIARRLNAKHVPAEDGHPWTAHRIVGILTYPKYNGDLVWARTTRVLQSVERATPPNTWVVRKTVFQPIIDPRIYSRVQALLRKNSGKRIPDAEIIRAFRQVYKKHGRISESLVGGANGTYSLCPVYRRFGSVRSLYHQIGYKYLSSAVEHGEKTVKARKRLLEALIQSSGGRLSAFQLPHAGHRHNLLIDGEHRIYVWTALHQDAEGGDPRWKLRPKVRENDGHILLCLMQHGNQIVKTMYLSRTLALRHTSMYTFTASDKMLSGLQIIDDAKQLCDAIRCTAPSPASDSSPS